MKISATSIRNKEVNLDLDDLKKLLSFVIYPDYLHEFETLSIMIVCVRGEVHQHEAYIHQGKPYVSIALDYDAVAGLSYDEITVLCKKELVAYLNTLSGLPEKKVA
ncbi:MAG: hypothetical protein H6557_19385 [Lewinellaceae bacterium]|nr:hypothetical protein [Phaeodactylibacter sp.]MCB9038782.1 hypothetical protein [Lewinellaceae bacterium]